MATKTSQISAKIKANLAFQGKSQIQLAEALGLTRESLNRRLSGKTSWEIDEVMAVSTYLEMPFEDLMADVRRFVA